MVITSKQMGAFYKYGRESYENLSGAKCLSGRNQSYGKGSTRCGTCIGKETADSGRKRDTGNTGKQREDWTIIAATKGKSSFLKKLEEAGSAELKELEQKRECYAWIFLK